MARLVLLSLLLVLRDCDATLSCCGGSCRGTAAVHTRRKRSRQQWRHGLLLSLRSGTLCLEHRRRHAVCWTSLRGSTAHPSPEDTMRVRPCHGTHIYCSTSSKGLRQDQPVLVQWQAEAGPYGALGGAPRLVPPGLAGVVGVGWVAESCGRGPGRV